MPLGKGERRSRTNSRTIGDLFLIVGELAVNSVVPFILTSYFILSVRLLGSGIT